MNFNNFATKNNKNIINNVGAQAVFNFLLQPAIINKMIVFSDSELPAITGIVKELEDEYKDDKNFPLTDFRNRQTVGKMVKYILYHYGYTPLVRGLGSQTDRRTQLREFAGSQCFTTASVYTKTIANPENKLVITTI